MKLECLNDIITENLAIFIDLTNINSWDLNSGYTSISLTKWNGAISDNINLIDFGLTEFDNGRTNIMWSGITLSPQDTLFPMYRIGYNDVINPTSGETNGVSANTLYYNYEISGITSDITGNYFELYGGYLQGFIGLEGYNYQLLPYRFINGMTIETLVCLYQESEGIFYMMGIRAEDKYNPFYTGEFITGGTSITGITTSMDSYLESMVENVVLKSSFRDFNDKTTIEFSRVDQLDNQKNNAIAFELTQNKRLAYKYIDNDGNILTNSSNASILNTGFTLITINFKPDEIIDDIALIDCYKQRHGKLTFYINGRSVWTVTNFPEFYFKPLVNEPEKQIGVPYSISWGGGSFGLKNSWHYDYQTYYLYSTQNTQYINDNFSVLSNPTPTDCDPSPTINPLDGLLLSADTSTFFVTNECNPDVETPLTVMRVEYTGNSLSSNTYFIEFNQPISILSNREYVAELLLYNGGFFKLYDDNGNRNSNTLSIFIYGDNDVESINNVKYVYPISGNILDTANLINTYPFPDKREYEYVRNGVMYYGKTGIPVFSNDITIYGTYRINDENDSLLLTTIQNNYITGENQWLPINITFKIEDNTGQQFLKIGILIETNDTFNLDLPLFIHNFTYSGADILVQDDRKNNLLIEQNFNSNFVGGIQKLRIYDNALSSAEILHNAIIESKINPNLNLLISKGGRIIYR